MPRPLRSSCDRCHSQKLKCPKQPGVTTCSRCLRAGTPCVFSPAGPIVRRNVPTPIRLDGDLTMNMQFDWPSLNLENVLATPPEITQELQTDTNQLDGQEAASQDPRSILVRQLTDLAVKVDRLSQDLSSISRVHVPKNRPAMEYRATFIDHNARHVCVEHVFTHAQCLIDAYPQVLGILFDKSDLLQCQDPNCFHTVELPNELENFFSGMDHNQNGVDIFLFNLLVSCHTKVLDVMEIIVNCARTCTQVTFSSPDLVEPNVQIPEVRVGDFVATNSAAGTMQTALLVHVASVLVDCARRLSKQVSEIVEQERNRKQVQMLKLQCELLEEKATSEMKSLERVRSLFTNLFFVK